MKTQLLFLCLLGGVLSAQTRIDVNLDMVHTVNGTDSFERAKHIVIHENLFSNDWDSDAQRAQFLNDYNVYLGRDNGQLGWQYNQSFEDPNRPGYPDVARLAQKGAAERQRYANSAAARALEERASSNMIGGQIFNFPASGPTNPNPCCGPSAPWTYANEDAVGLFMATVLKEFYGEGGDSGQPRPTMVEVINEPFVKDQQYNVTRQEMTEWHNDVAARIKEITPDVMVGGYSAAFPAFEGGNFGIWNNSWKLFIDGAGENMDFYSIHLYDFGDRDDPAGTIAYRSGSNVEAILDMVESYSVIKDGAVKPWNISEYGYWSPGWNNTRYTKQRDWHFIRSMSTMMIQFLERPDVMLKTVPFLLTKASWADGGVFNRYPHRLLRQKLELEGETGNEWVYTEQLKFYQLWSDVVGKRLDTYSPDPDIQVDAYAEGQKTYLILNNLESVTKELTLNLIDQHNAHWETVRIKHLYQDDAGLPTLEETTVSREDLNKRFDLGAQATAILEFSFRRPLNLSHTSEEKKYYADRMLQPIRTNQGMDFVFNDVAVSPNGEASLRLSFGRAKNLSRRPTVKINGQEISVPSDYRGDEQENRDEFFGTVEIPVAMSDLNQGANTVEVTFSDPGGHVSSVSLQTWAFSREVNRGSSTTSTGDVQLPAEAVSIYPNPATTDLVISLDGNLSTADLSLRDIQGRALRQVSGLRNNHTLSLAGLPAGTYLLRITTEEGVADRKFVKR